MRFNNKHLPRSQKDYVKGLSSPVAYEVRNTNGDWLPFSGDYHQQKYGRWDTESCWARSGCNVIETQLEYLMKNGLFSSEAINWFTQNGYLGQTGDFGTSARYIEILSGVRDNGNDQINFWKLVSKYGLIPLSDLDYSISQANQFPSQADFDNDYFDPSKITDSMRAKGQQFLSYINVAYEWVGRELVMPNLVSIKAALFQSPLQIGIPVDVFNWNSNYVKWDGGKDPAHAVMLYKINPDGSFCIFDQYEPHLKTLSADYYIPMVTNGVITVRNQIVSNPIDQAAVNPTVWRAVYEWFRSIFQ